MKTIEILFVNPAKTGNKNGKAWSMTEGEALIHCEDGSLQAGALLFSKTIDPLTIKPGYYTPTFDVVANYQDRKIEAVIAGLVPAPTFKRFVPSGGVPAQVQKV